jgi:hypothetical protein
MNDYTTLRVAVASSGSALLDIQRFPTVSVDRTLLAALLAEVDQLRAAAPAKKPRTKKAVPDAGAVDALPTWLPVDAWTAFLEMRKKIKKPATEYAQKLLLKKLAAFYANEFDPLQILNQSTLNGWQDLYAPKEIGAALRGQFAQRPPVADQNRANNAEALRLLGQPMFSDDDMTIEATP